jgi:hypothetical protein
MLFALFRCGFRSDLTSCPKPFDSWLPHLARILVDFVGSQLAGFGFSLCPEKKEGNDASYDGGHE